MQPIQQSILNKSVIALAISSLLSACGGSSSNSGNNTTPSPTPTTNTAPVANAGADRHVTINQLVTLDGSSSSDAENDPLSYNWVLTQQPDNSQTTLLNQTAVDPELTPDVAGTYHVSLIVSDGELSSTEDVIILTASASNVDITNVNFTNLSGHCTDYVGTYFSNVSDIQRNVGFSGDVNILSANEKCSFSVNEIPNHDFNDSSAHFATNVSTQNGAYEIPVSPTIAASATQLSLSVTNVLMLNGVTVDLLAAACYGVGNEPLGEEKIGCGNEYVDHPWRYDPMSSLNQFGTDSHNAHSQPDGTYHYHGDPKAMFDQDCEATGEASPVIGFAADGFPVYGPCFNDNGVVRKAESSYVLKTGERQAVSGYTTPVAGVGGIASSNYDGQFRGDYRFQTGAGDLDACNGMTINGQYGYYITDSYPWVIGCFSGTVDDSFRRTGPGLQNRMHTH